MKNMKSIQWWSTAEGPAERVVRVSRAEAWIKRINQSCNEQKGRIPGRENGGEEIWTRGNWKKPRVAGMGDKGKKGSAMSLEWKPGSKLWKDLIGHYKDLGSKCNRKLEVLKRRSNLIWMFPWHEPWMKAWGDLEGNCNTVQWFEPGTSQGYYGQRMCLVTSTEQRPNSHLQPRYPNFIVSWHNKVFCVFSSLPSSSLPLPYNIMGKVKVAVG